MGQGGDQSKFKKLQLKHLELRIIKPLKNWDRITCQKSTPTSTQVTMQWGCIAKIISCLNSLTFEILINQYLMFFHSWF